MVKLFTVLLFMPLIAMTQNLTIAPKVKFLALGDSYTIGQSVSVKERWPAQLIDSLKNRGLSCYDPKIIATTGWRTDNLKNAIISANLPADYTLVSLLIGVNNYYQGKTLDSYKPEFEDLLTTAIKLAGGDKSHVFVVSIPDYGYTPFGQPNQKNISQGIDAFNDADKSIAAKLGVAYFYITDISRNGLIEPDLVAGDGLHPSGKMYSEWVKRIIDGANITKVELPNTDSTDTGMNTDTISPGGNGTTPTGGSTTTGSQPNVGSANPPTGVNTTSPVTSGNAAGTITKVENESQVISIYPNPFGDQLVFENLPSGKMTSLRIVDSKGCLIYNKRLNSSIYKLDTSGFAEDVYHYQLYDETGVVDRGNLVKSVVALK